MILQNPCVCLNNQLGAKSAGIFTVVFNSILFVGGMIYAVLYLTGEHVKADFQNEEVTLMLISCGLAQIGCLIVAGALLCVAAIRFNKASDWMIKIFIASKLFQILLNIAQAIFNYKSLIVAVLTILYCMLNVWLIFIALALMDEINGVNRWSKIGTLFHPKKTDQDEETQMDQVEAQSESEREQKVQKVQIGTTAVTIESSVLTQRGNKRNSCESEITNVSEEMSSIVESSRSFVTSSEESVHFNLPDQSVLINPSQSTVLQGQPKPSEQTYRSMMNLIHHHDETKSQLNIPKPPNSPN